MLCALSPFANGTSQPATESMVATFADTSRDTGLSQKKLSEAATHFKQVAQQMEDDGLLDSKVLRVDAKTLCYQVPGGMLSNLFSQLKQAKAEMRIDEVLREVPIVRADFGFPPLVTPTSQIIGTQAVMNILTGKRYKCFTNESKMLLRGEYGQLPGQVNEEVRKKAIGDAKVITCRPANLLKPEMKHLKTLSADFAYCDEDVLSYALFPQIAPDFLKKKYHAEKQEIIHEINVEWKV